MILRDGIVLLEFTDLVNDECLTRAAYDSANRRGVLNVVQKGGGGHPALIDWTTLPEQYKDMVRKHLGGDPTELAPVKSIERFLKVHPEDERYLDDFRAANGHGLQDDRKAALKKAARVLALLAQLDELRRTAGNEAIAKVFGMNMMPLKQAILAYVKLEKLALPTSLTRLEARKRAYLEARGAGKPGASTLVHGGFGNKNCAKVDDVVRNAVLQSLCSQHQNFSMRSICRQYNVVARNNDWPVITACTVINFLKNGENGRSATFYAKGLARYNDKHGIVNHRSRPSAPTLLWVSDGHVYELYYQREQGGRTTYHHRKTVVVVLDPYNWYPVGYAIGDVDDIALAKQAVKNAVEHVFQLTGEYLMLHQMQTDRLGRVEFAEWYGGMGVTYTPAKARLARSKVIEPYFRHHDDKYVQAFPNYGGHNVDAKKENQPNRDTLERFKHAFPNEAGVIEQIHEAFAQERAEKAEVFIAGLKAMHPEQRRVISRARFLEVFGTVHARLNGEPFTNELTNAGICPTLLGEKRFYNLLTKDFQDRVGQSFQVTYDPADLSTILVSANHGGVKYLVPETQLIPMALADHTAETRAQLATAEQFKKEIGQAAIDKPYQQAEAVRRLAERLLFVVNMPNVETRGRKRKGKEERTLDITAEQEGVIKSYAQVDGSHKKALRLAENTEQTPPPAPPEVDWEKRAWDML